MYQRKLYESPKLKEKAIENILNSLYNKIPQEMGHSKGVSKICELLGKQLGFSKDKLEEITDAGALHDIGKINVDAKIINKPTTLDDSEWVEIKRHPVTGYHILNSANKFANIAKFVLYHHEHWDGSGYPDGLKGEEIPLQSRIIGIADAYNAMVSHRSYKKTFTKFEAIEEIKRSANTHFDPDITEEFVTCMQHEND